jgi:hypothetical protein
MARPNAEELDGGTAGGESYGAAAAGRRELTRQRRDGGKAACAKGVQEYGEAHRALHWAEEAATRQLDGEVRREAAGAEEDGTSSPNSTERGGDSHGN